VTRNKIYYQPTYRVKMHHKMHIQTSNNLHTHNCNCKLFLLLYLALCTERKGGKCDLHPALFIQTRNTNGVRPPHKRKPNTNELSPCKKMDRTVILNKNQKINTNSWYFLPNESEVCRSHSKQNVRIFTRFLVGVKTFRTLQRATTNISTRNPDKFRI
jgi:hypothetical protein